MAGAANGVSRAAAERAGVLRCEDCGLVGLGNFAMDREWLVQPAGMGGQDDAEPVRAWSASEKAPSADACKDADDEAGEWRRRLADGVVATVAGLEWGFRGVWARNFS